MQSDMYRLAFKKEHWNCTNSGKIKTIMVFCVLPLQNIKVINYSYNFQEQYWFKKNNVLYAYFILV